jgi:hypothetical protein
LLQVSTSNSKHETLLQMEAWLDDTLSSSQHQQQQQAASSQPARTAQQQHEQARMSGPKGAGAAGLARQQLLAAGLSNTAVDQLYRSLYVYSVGFFDSIKVSWNCRLTSTQVSATALL